MLNEQGLISPFGWAIESEEHNLTGEVELRSLVQWSSDVWRRHFPAERGYDVHIDPFAITARSLRMTARRGDFRAEVSIEYEEHRRKTRDICSRRASLRVFGQARYHLLRRAYEQGERWIAGSRTFGSLCGIGVFLSLAWLMIGVHDPIYVLGGMLLMVALLLNVLAGATLGAWLGEQVASRYKHHAYRIAEHDQGLVHDLQRWKSVSRQLITQRSVLRGNRRPPFRQQAPLHEC